MAYKTPIVCKEIYLTIEENDSLTLAEYESKYGIDLRPFLKVESKYIRFFFEGYVKAYVVDISEDTTQLWNNGAPSRVNPLIEQRFVAWEEGVDDMDVSYGVKTPDDDVLGGIRLSVNNLDEVSLDNLKIEYSY